MKHGDGSERFIDGMHVNEMLESSPCLSFRYIYYYWEKVVKQKNRHHVSTNVILSLL